MRARDSLTDLQRRYDGPIPAEEKARARYPSGTTYARASLQGQILSLARLIRWTRETAQCRRLRFYERSLKTLQRGLRKLEKRQSAA